MKNGSRELWAGVAAFIAAAVIFFVIGTQKQVAEKARDTYLLSARFNQAEGLIPGNEIRIAGIKVGKVIQEKLDDHYGVIVTFSVPNEIRLPDDSGASIQSDSLFGAKFIEIVPGGSEEMMQHGDMLSFTEDSLNLERLLDKVIAMAKADRAKKRCP